MPKVQFNGAVGIAEMESAFPYQIQPSFSQTDQVINFTPNVIANNSYIKIDPQLNCMYPQPLFVPHNQKNTSSTSIYDDGAYIRTGLPGVLWSQITYATPASLQAFAFAPFSMQYFDIQCTDETMAADMLLDAITNQVITSSNPDPVDMSISGFTCFLSRTNFHFVDPENSTQSDWEIQFILDGILYNLQGGTGNFANFAYFDTDLADFITINGKVKVGSNILGVIGNTRNEDNNGSGIQLEVFALNGSFLLSVNGQQPLVIAVPSAAPYPKITQIEIIAHYFTQISWHVHPMKSATTDDDDNDPMVESPPVQIGFVPDPSTPVKYIVVSLLGGNTLDDGNDFIENTCDITVNTVSDTIGTAITQYDLSIVPPQIGTYNGQNYGDDFAGVVRITSAIAPITQIFPWIPRMVAPKYVEEVVTFDLNSLSVYHSCRISLSNWQGIDFWANELSLPTFGSGNYGVALRFGWNNYPPAPDGGIGYPRFYGFCNKFSYDRPSSNIALVTMDCVDQMQQLQDTLMVAPPDIDGWNHFCAMAYMAMKAGISPFQLGFAQYVPTLNGTLFTDPYGVISPYDPSSGIPDSLNYFLPFGLGLQPWTPVNRAMPVLDLMQFVRKVTGFLLFIDVFGYLQYAPWIPPSATPPLTIYTENPSGGIRFDGELTEIWNLHAEAGTQNTRNVVVIIGIDSYGTDWNPIVERREDSGSIRNYPGVPAQSNHIGYQKPFVWMDSRFAIPEFAQLAADQIFKIVTLPDYEITFTTWLQPDLNVMDVIYVQDSKSDSLGVPFYVMEVRSVLSALTPQIQLSTTVKGKFLL